MEDHHQISQSSLRTKTKLFTKYQEYVSKDVQRAFGVLQDWFVIICGPIRHMEKADFGLIMKECVILHNIIVDDEYDSYNLAYDYEHVKGNTLD